MDEINELIMLYDYYGELLSDSQNAVHKQIKSAEAKLKEYEEKLKIIKKSNLIKEKLKSTKDERLKEEIIDILES